MAMISKNVLKELLEALARYPGGFVVLEESQPKFVILDIESYKKALAGKSPIKLPEKQPKRILVTGGAGYIGSHAARLLVERGHEVTVLDNLSTGFQKFASGKFVEGDLADREVLDQVFAAGKFDAVMHFAASIAVEESARDPYKYYLNNVVNGLNLLAAMQRWEVKRLIFSSSCTVYAEDATSPIGEKAKLGPVSPYGETKLVFENILKWHARAGWLSSVTLRYFNAVGASLDASLGLANPESSLLLPNVLDAALGRKEAVQVFGGDYNTHDGTAVRDYIHVLDLAEAHLLALDYLSGQSEPVAEVFNVGTGRGYSVMEIISAACELTGHMIKFEIAPRRAGDREKIFADCTKIKKTLGFSPQYSDLATIIKTAWNWHKKQFGK
jgi:UDP-glucose 4-epimerase